MSITISEEIKSVIQDTDSRKVLATVDKEGNPHVVCKGTITMNDEGYLEYLELIETSQTNKNMVYSIWNHKTVAVNITSGSRSFQIKGIPYRALISGREFEKRYRFVKETLGADLSTVWLIEPVEIIEETFEKRRNEEEKAHPILKHLDWLLPEGERL